MLALVSGLLLRILFTLDPDLMLYRHMGGLGADIGSGTSILLPIAEMLRYSVIINIILMVFNLIPIPPLDGGRVMVGLLPEKQADALSAVEPYGFLIILFFLFLDPFKVLHHMLGFLIAVFYSFILGGVGL